MFTSTTGSNSSVNNNMAPNPNSPSPNRLGVFGGESTGFAHGVEALYAKSFYSKDAVPDQ